MIDAFKLVGKYTGMKKKPSKDKNKFRILYSRWAMPVSTASAYIGVVTVLFAISTFVGNAIFEFAKSYYSISNNYTSFEEMKKDYALSNEAKEENFSISYPQFTRMLPNDFLFKVDGVLKEIAHSELSPNSLVHFADYKVAHDSRGLISIVMSNDIFYEGSLNPSSSLAAINVDVENKRYLGFFDVFSGGYEAASLVKEVVRNKIPCDGLFDYLYFERFYIPRFAIHEDYIEFIFSEYEVTPGVCGSFSVEVSYDELSPFLNNQGPLSHKVSSIGAWRAESHRWNSLERIIQEGYTEALK